MEDDQWSLRTFCAYIGMGKVTVGGSIMIYAIRNIEISNWAQTQFAFGGAMVFSGMLYLSLAWNMDPPTPPPNPPPNRSKGRVGIPRAENERDDPDLAGDGLILHQNFPPAARNVVQANLHNVGEARPAKFVAGESRAGSGGLLRRRHVQQVHEDQEIGDNKEFGPDNAGGEVGQAKASEGVGQADDMEESNQAHNEGELGQDTDESESANVVNESALSKNVGEEEPKMK